MTDKLFIEAITEARRNSKFFPTEKNILDAAGIRHTKNCRICTYYNNGMCANLQRDGFSPANCQSFNKINDWI